MSTRRKTTSGDPRKVHTRPSDTVIDPARAVLLGNDRVAAQARARALIEENGRLLKLLGTLLERTGPVELDKALLDDQRVIYRIESYDSHDGKTQRWVSVRDA